MIILPWQQSVFDGWSIVGMNHYRVDGRRHLFVSMAKRGRCIKVEGFDCPELWTMLADQARTVECQHDWTDMRNSAIESGENAR